MAGDRVFEKLPHRKFTFAVMDDFVVRYGLLPELRFGKTPADVDESDCRQHADDEHPSPTFGPGERLDAEPKGGGKEEAEPVAGLHDAQSLGARRSRPGLRDEGRTCAPLGT